MFLKANPDKGKSAQEKEEMRKRYAPGENMLPPVDIREESGGSEDERLLDDVRAMSLQHVDRQRTSRGGGHGTIHGRPRRERSPNSRTTYLSYGAEELGRSQQPSSVLTQRSERQVEHQTSLRSLLSTSELDSTDLEEEIMQQIMDEGLLEGVDLNNLTMAQEEDLTERIATAFRRRRRERSRQPVRPPSPVPQQARIRNQTRTSSASSAYPPVSRPHLFETAREETSRRQRSPNRTGHRSSRSSHQEVPRIDVPRNAARSAVDLSERPRTGDAEHDRRRPLESERRVTDPENRHIASQVRSRPPTALPPRIVQQSNGAQQPPAARAVSDPVPRPTPFPNASTELTSVGPTNGTPGRAHVGALPNPAIVATNPAVRSSRAQESPRENSLSFVRQQHPALAITPVLNIARLLPLQDQGGQTARPSSSSASAPSQQSAVLVSAPLARPTFIEPNVSCPRCHSVDIQYSLHYNCNKCEFGAFNLCLPCYRTGRGCLQWYGFGYAAEMRYQRQASSEGNSSSLGPPHTLTARRWRQYNTSEVVTTVHGAANGRLRTYDDPSHRFQQGAFCESCFAHADICYWHCDFCNDGAWGFCNACVQQGRHCTHPLLSVAHINTTVYAPNYATANAPALPYPSNGSSPMNAPPSDSRPSPPSVRHASKPRSQQIDGPATVNLPNLPPTLGPYVLQHFITCCDICRTTIAPTHSRFHCHQCSHGDYDLCTQCYYSLVQTGKLRPEDGPEGWRRCLRGHRMVIVQYHDFGPSATRTPGLRRVVESGMVGGWALKESAAPANPTAPAANVVPDPAGGTWRWRDNGEQQTASSHTQPHHQRQTLPPPGGVGLRVVALWSYFPAAGVMDELAFPRGAELVECENINGDWFWGVYAGCKGLFPGNYVRVV
ncbi:hypothetical protein LTR50_007740 [Elasticomyces elasticus]|nr:hypothetical protein LTR50_007740 [Elasticomyces elasticus]